MKTIKCFLFAVLGLVVLTGIALAQTNTVPVPAALPADLAGYWDLAIAAVTPVIVWLVAKLVPKVPAPLLPCLTPFIGIGLGLGVNALSSANLTWFDMAKAGALAVFIREVINQNVTKRLVTAPAAPPSVTSTLK